MYIKREDAIRELYRSSVYKWSVEEDQLAHNWAISIIESLPSADAEWIPREHFDVLKKNYDMLAGLLEEAKARAIGAWIPCSERLPSESGDYLCTIPLDADETYTEVLMFHKGRFYEDDDEWGATYHDDVLAWMPLPTPYKESEAQE